MQRHPKLHHYHQSSRLALKEAWWLSSFMSARLVTAGLLAVCIGCGRQPASAPSSAEPKADTTLPAVVRQVDPLATSAAPDEAQIAAVLNELTQAVRKYGVEQRRVPKTLEELVAKGYLSRVPQAPAGKRFAVNKELQVYLANR